MKMAALGQCDYIMILDGEHDMKKTYDSLMGYTRVHYTKKAIITLYNASKR